MIQKLKEIKQNMEQTCWKCKAGFLAPCSDCGYKKIRAEFYACSPEEQNIILGIKEVL